MKTYFSSIFFLLLVFSSCGGKTEYSVKDYLKNADSISIAFYENKDHQSSIVINDKASIEKLGGFIEGKSTGPLKCAETGSIWFFENGKKKMEVDFSMNGECHVFSYMMNDKIFTKMMSEDAAEYLTEIRSIATGHIVL